jgi:hypothetical protein
LCLNACKSVMRLQRMLIYVSVLQNILLVDSECDVSCKVRDLTEEE